MQYLPSTYLPLKTLPNFASFENRKNSQCAGLIVKRLNTDDEKHQRIIIETRLANDRRRIHILADTLQYRQKHCNAADYRHGKKVRVRNTRYSQTVRVQSAHSQPHKEKRKDRQGDYPDWTQDYS